MPPIPPDWTPDIPEQQLVMISLALGLIVPWLAAFLNQCDWLSWVKRLVVFAFSTVTAAIALCYYGHLDTSNLATAALTVLAASVYFYDKFFGNTIRDFEVKTSMGPKIDTVIREGSDGRS